MTVTPDQFIEEGVFIKFSMHALGAKIQSLVFMDTNFLLFSVKKSVLLISALMTVYSIVCMLATDSRPSTHASRNNFAYGE